MKSNVLYWGLVGLALVTHAASASKIVVGNHQLQPNTAGQRIQIFVTGNDPVHGMNFNLQVADGGRAAGGVIQGPAITAVDVVTDPNLIFFGNHTAPIDPGSLPQIAIRSVTTSGGTVTANGLLAIVTFDTTGIAPGTFPLTMESTRNGASDFAGVPITIVEGSIVIGTQTSSPNVSVKIRNVSSPSVTMIEMTFVPQPGYDHWLQFNTQPLSGSVWQDLPAGPHNTGHVVDSPGNARLRFYRLRLVRP